MSTQNGTHETVANGKPRKGRIEAEAGGVTADRLRSFVERIERLEEEKRELAGDIKEVYAEAKSSGYDTKILRKVISLRRLEDQERREMDELLAVYMHALGMRAAS